jgi:excisionase family DNA binding protein
MTAPAALACTFRETARLLHIDRGETLHALIRQGDLRPVPWGKGRRIPREQIEALARRGFTIGERRSRAGSLRRVAPAPGRIRDLPVE